MTGREGLLTQPGREPYADLAETRSAEVFFASDRAYKQEEPVRTGFLDFSRPPAALAPREPSRPR
ncbi:MAG: hypothetical protein ACLP5E_07475 [Streptosporangiaceae bacterium]